MLFQEEQAEDKDKMEGDQPPIDKPAKPTDPDNDSSSEAMARQANVRKWCEKISKARKRYEDEFNRMRENMDFVYGLQWKTQKTLRYPKYVVNLTLRAINQGVAALYARDPKVCAKRRKRLDFKLWDEKLETIMQAAQIVQMGAMIGAPIPPDITAMLQDFQQGRMKQALVDKVGKTLEVLCQYQIDSQSPNFKTQMKQLVRRVRTCGVGYIKVIFCRDYENQLTQSATRDNTMDRAKSARAILAELEEGKIQDDDAKVERLKSLVSSLGTQPLDAETVKIKEHLVFDFPQATSIIPDPQCRALKGFVGARWIVEEYYYPLSFVNAYFEKDIKPGGSLKIFGENRNVDEPNVAREETDSQKNLKVRLWEVQDLDSKSTFIICDGYKDYVQEPELITATKGFWNIFAVTFNDIEVEEGCQGTVFPPSDVDMLFSTQVEWNAIRQRLSRHRRANAPIYGYADGSIEQDDIDRITNSEDQEFVKLKTTQPGQSLKDILVAFPAVPIADNLYDTAPQSEDTLLVTGQQEANIGPAQPNVTATVGTIAEESRRSVAASDVDGLDDSLTDVFQCGGELLLREMSPGTVTQIVGPGAVWPMQNKEEFINEIELGIEAGSSGRPKQAIDVSNFQQLAPLIMSAAQMPPQMQTTGQALIRQAVKVMNANLDPADFFPMPAAMPGQDPNQPTTGPQPQGQPGSRPPKPQGGKRQPPTPNQSGNAVPVVGHHQ